MGAAPLLIGLIALPFGITSLEPPVGYLTVPIMLASPVVGGLLVGKPSAAAAFKIASFIWLGFLAWLWATVVYPSLCRLCAGSQVFFALNYTIATPLGMPAIALVIALSHTASNASGSVSDRHKASLAGSCWNERVPASCVDI
jgi:hypothetical protein